MSSLVSLPLFPNARPCCRECGQEVADTMPASVFCRTACRKAFNNRRAIRGAEIYDLLMSVRFERGTAKALGLWSLLCRMCSVFAEEDARERAGRPSWTPPAEALTRKARYRATRIG